jgi:hypothetical protein
MQNQLNRVLLLAVVVLAGVSGASTQPRGDRNAQLLERLKSDLALSDTVVAKIDTLLQAQRAESMKAREAFGDDREGFMEAMRARREKTDKAIEALLTDEQVVTYRKIREDMRQNFRGGQRPPGQ